LLEEQMGSTRAVRLGEVLEPAGLPGLVAERDGERIGLLTYIVDGDQFEVLSLHCRVENAGIPMRDLLELELPLPGPDMGRRGSAGFRRRLWW
jgi:hypothetical protein